MSPLGLGRVERSEPGLRAPANLAREAQLEKICWEGILNVPAGDPGPSMDTGRDHVGARTYPLIASSTAGTPTMFKTRVRL
jgi:hypothetical protein